MKIAVMVRQLDLGHILWCGRVVRVKHAHRIRVVRGAQKMLDVGRHGVIDFGHIRFVARDRAVTYVFHEDKFVERCVAQHRAGDIDSACEGWRSRSMSPLGSLDSVVRVGESCGTTVPGCALSLLANLKLSDWFTSA